jgi:hypothetical protein
MILACRTMSYVPATPRTWNWYAFDHRSSLLTRLWALAPSRCDVVPLGETSATTPWSGPLALGAAGFVGLLGGPRATGCGGSRVPV